MIAGTLVNLRPVRAADLTLLRRWEQDPRIAEMLGIRATALDSRESPEQEYDRLLHTPRVKLLAIETPEGEVAGFLRLNDVDLIARKATLRIFIAPDMQGRGYGGDALRTLADYCFCEMGLHRLGLAVREDNARALGLYERLGFVVEGRERDAIWAEGRWVSYLHLGLRADERYKQQDHQQDTPEERG
jgi:RimJ/RimL family protein N-acetyltransferase